MELQWNFRSVRQKLYYNASIFIFKIQFNIVPMCVANKICYYDVIEHYHL